MRPKKIHIDRVQRTIALMRHIDEFLPAYGQISEYIEISILLRKKLEDGGLRFYMTNLGELEIKELIKKEGQ